MIGDWRGRNLVVDGEHPCVLWVRRRTDIGSLVRPLHEGAWKGLVALKLLLTRTNSWVWNGRQ